MNIVLHQTAYLQSAQTLHRRNSYVQIKHEQYSGSPEHYSYSCSPEHKHCLGSRIEKGGANLRHDDQPFGSMPKRSRRWRQASFTQALKLPCPATASICSNRASSKRIFFFVLPFRSKAGLDFSSCIGTYQYCRVNLNGTYQILIKQQKQRNPAVVQTHTGLLTTNDRLDIEVAMLDHTTHPQGRNSLTLNKFTWRFLALSRTDRKAKPCRMSVIAHTEREARSILAPHFILSLAARLPVEVCHA